MRGYLKKSIAVFQAAYFIVVIHWDVMRILGYFVDVNKIYFYATGWLYIIIFYLLYLLVTLIFFFLADLGFETRTKIVRPETTKSSVNPDINFSTAYDSAKMSLLQDNSVDSKLDTYRLSTRVQPGAA